MKEFKVLKPYATALQNYPSTIPWDMLDEKWANHNHSQTLSRLNERGGMCVSEIWHNIKKEKLNFHSKETQEDVDALNELIAEYKAQNS